MEATISKPIPRTSSRALLIFSRVASFLFHPFFMTAIMAFAIYKWVPGSFSEFSYKAFKKWFAKLSTLTILFPFLAVIIFKLSGLISNAVMHEARDRILPLITALFFYFIAYWLLAQPLNDDAIRSLLLGSCSSIIIIFTINLFYKVSVHTSAAAILPGLCLVLLVAGRLPVFLPLIIGVIIAAVVGLVRWLLGAHTPGQIFLGYAVGLGTQGLAYLLTVYSGF